ncbi:MAG TPA: Gfo/Idh/MocA family oxidoreductase [Candidatus Thioglobus sp.]|jgi:predicted dehydrogenase|nr:Gfo/Idh/MocA family oxidoreductase [Candidatus Thioglobus sp.]HIL42803.1 Gfo/Idh/MocA family oxidoreductase [Gammaproteobacteria bacterium]
MRFGILGEAKIAREWVAPAILEAGHEISHIGRRKPGKKVLPEIYNSTFEVGYEELLSDASIDAIYIPLPNHLHVPYSIKALKAGKHVLCEKPVALTLEELTELKSVASDSDCYFQEAYMIEHHPQWHWLKGVDIGNIKSAQVIFSYPPQPEGNYRNVEGFGGGPLYDIGCYAILAGCLVFGGTPEVLSAESKLNNRLGIESQIDATLRWPNGEVLSFFVSSEAALCQSLLLLGDGGWAKLNVPFNPPKVTHSYWSKGGLDMGEQISFPSCNQYKLMVDDFVTKASTGERSNFEVSLIVTKTINEIQRKCCLRI